MNKNSLRFLIIFKSIKCPENKTFENHCAKQVLHLVFTTTYKVGNIIIPLCRWENWGTERYSNLLKVTKEVKRLESKPKPVSPRPSDYFVSLGSSSTLLGLWAVQGSGPCRQPRGLLRQGRLRQAVASCLLCVLQVLRASGGPHLLLEGRCALVWPPLLWECPAPVLRLWWGKSWWGWMVGAGRWHLYCGRGPKGQGE